MEASAKVICDSIAHGSRLITFEIELHRFILPEFNTHRTFSRNFQSSRALPLARQREMVIADPALPVFWGSNKAGMVAGAELGGEDLRQAKSIWMDALNYMAECHEKLEKLGLHKQLTNRLLEPWMATKGVVTATESAFKAFYKLRCAPDAQPEIKALADAMHAAMEASQPRGLDEGEWHLPYVDLDTFEGTIEEALKVSTSCTGQVSYRNLDDSLDKALRVYGMLNLDGKDGNPHASPCEHQAEVSTESFDHWDEYSDVIDDSKISGNLEFPWYQHRKVLGV